jgi:hypothetical protein
MMMILGVALWMFPRPQRNDVRYRPAIAEAAYWLLTVSTAVRFVGEVVPPGAVGPLQSWLVVLAPAPHSFGAGCGVACRVRRDLHARPERYIRVSLF